MKKHIKNYLWTEKIKKHDEIPVPDLETQWWHKNTQVLQHEDASMHPQTREQRFMY